MKSNELRIGNYVNYEGDSCLFELDDFKNIEFDELSSCYEPIPLTEEWLLRFGFEFDGEQINGKYYKKEINYSSGYRDYLSITDKGAGYLFMLTSNYEKHSILPFEYKHVHQLQNLYFALTGKELEYEKKM